ncbi:peptidylprolyl isomerase [uncultured Draconibacterium sp.]|uniref:peptidylprolyl isomerase n=1 Tax=uncultured Draconibacterium sp. TaxID=1573823 RepID=UPI0032164CBC
MNRLVAILFIALYLLSCGTKEKPAKENTAEASETKEAQKQNEDEEWAEILSALVKIDSYDGSRILESGQGFFVGENLVVTKYSLVTNATQVKLTPFDGEKAFAATRFVAFDRINDLIILQVDSVKRTPVALFTGVAPQTAKSIYVAPKTGKTIQLFSGKVLNLATVRGTKLYRITNLIRNSQIGAPVFVSNRKAIGVAFSATVDYKQQSFAIPSMYISEMLNKREDAKALEVLKTTSNAKIAAENAKIKGLVLETEAGDITLKLFNETPAYRDNFIRLAKEHYFDSLLVHRVIADFGIQSGAADTRYAEPKASVGWKGPGYTIPSHIVPGLYHKRGMIGSPRKPDTHNQRRRSDGSQFYIVSGRIYYDHELDDLEKQNDYKFSAAQRNAYKTIGGAPHLDGTYTIFGEVISGMDVVDKIVKVKTDDRWRPVEDIRIKQVRILK